ncbi:Receptor expression-enhancing protein 5 [Trichinella papuae]|nr:Receptor expression-enhancing protein 5 [Trichinella papuae]
MRFAMKIHLLEKFLVKLKKRVVKIAIKLQHYICIGICDFEVLCNLICFCYPAIKTVVEMEDKEKINFNQLMFYWVVYGLFTIADFFYDFTSHIFPFCWLLKCIFFFWFFMPSCCAARKLYEKLIQPLYSQFFLFNNPGKEITIAE